MAGKSPLVELDALDITVVVDNEVDPISASQSGHVVAPGRMSAVPLTPLPPYSRRGDAGLEFRMDSICCGAHGLSLLITGVKDGVKHTMLFDAGPEGDVWERNAARLRLDPTVIEHMHLSHWHRDHSGGLPRALDIVSQGRKRAYDAATPVEAVPWLKNVVVEVHPDRPDCRGMKVGGGGDGGGDGVLISMEPDPTWEELMDRWGVMLAMEDRPHTILGDMFLVSGKIPRRTEYETGIRGGIRFSDETQSWTSDELIMDERFVACNLKGKGLVVFTGCSHAGVVNVCRHAMELVPNVPLFAVVGGFHLADATPEKMQASIRDLKALGPPRVLMPGHCSGWRFKFLAETEIPGVLVPSFSGTSYTLVKGEEDDGEGREAIGAMAAGAAPSQ